MIENIHSMTEQVAQLCLKLDSSNFNAPTGHLSILFKCRFPFWGGALDSSFPASSQVMLVLSLDNLL